MVTYGSICSGIEAATVAWESLGWEAAFFSEIEAFPRAVLAHHYPDVPLHGDFTQIANDPIDVDVLIGGTPCQSFSVAGFRRGLSDERGNLTLEFVRLADAIDTLRLARGRPPGIFLWENVPGVLHSSDNAFGCFLAGLVGDEQPLVPPDGWLNAGLAVGPTRTVCWRVLDAQHFGVAQRRRRVFVLATARKDIHPGEILPELGDGRRDVAPSPAPWPSDPRARAELSDRDGRGDAHPLRDGGDVGGAGARGGTRARVPLDVEPIGYASETGRGWWVNRLPTLRATWGPTKPGSLIGSRDAEGNLWVRGLIPVEAERLQGFPDGYTQIPWRKKPADSCPAGPRMKALGNTMAVPVIRWIGQRIQGVLNGVAPIGDPLS